MADIALVVIGQRRLFVIPVEQEDRCGLPDQAEEWTLKEVGLSQGGRIDFTQLFHAEIVAHADVKIGLCRRRLEQRAGVQGGVAHLGAFRVGVALHAKGERAARSPLRVKAALRPHVEPGSARLAKLRPVEVFRVRLEVVKNGLHRHARGKREQRSPAVVCARCRAVFKIDFHRFFCQGADGDGSVAGTPEHQRKQPECGEFWRKRVIFLIPPPAPAFAVPLPFLLRHHWHEKAGDGASEDSDEFSSAGGEFHTF